MSAYFPLGNDTYSNSIHICSADEVYDCFKRLPNDSSFQAAVSLEAISKSNAFTYPLRNVFHESESSSAKLPIVTWRTLVTTGKSPRPRYLHSATIIQSKCYTS